jgi:3-keto-5-aminohexanoate cleavage enzyme
MKPKIILAVAPTGGWGEGRGNPVTPEAIAADVIASAGEGAAVVHLHARDASGQLTTDLTAFNRAVHTIKQSCDIVLEASTGGLSDLSPADRVLPVGNPHVEMGSLNLGSLNFGDAVYRNALPDIRLWIAAMDRAGVKPSLEIFDTGHIDTALGLMEAGLLAGPCNFSFIFNVRWGMHYHPLLVELLKAKIPEGSRWGGLFIGSRDFSAHLAAAAAGASILRVGFEDATEVNGKTAADNAELVRALRAELEDSGFAIAGPGEARRMLLGDGG